MEIYKQEYGFRDIHIGEIFFIEKQTKDNYTLRVYPRDTSVEKVQAGIIKGKKVIISKEKAKENLTMYNYGIYRKGKSPNARPIFSITLSFDELNKELLSVDKEMEEGDELWIYKKLSTENGRIGVKYFTKVKDRLNQNDDLYRVDEIKKGEL